MEFSKMLTSLNLDFKIAGFVVKDKEKLLHKIFNFNYLKSRLNIIEYDNFVAKLNAIEFEDLQTLDK